MNEKLKELGKMNEVIKDLFKKDFDEVEKRTNERIAGDMLKNGEPFEKIKMYSRLAEDTIRNLAMSLGVSVC